MATLEAKVFRLAETRKALNVEVERLGQTLGLEMPPPARFDHDRELVHIFELERTLQVLRMANYHATGVARGEQSDGPE